MTNPAFLDLAKIGNIPESQLGKPTRKLFEIQQLGIAVAPTVVISPSELNAIFHGQPSAIKKLTKLYHQQFNNNFVSLYYIHNSNDVIHIQNIRGDANLIETIKESATQIHDKYLLVQACPQPTFSGIAFTRNTSTNDKRQIELQFMGGAFNEADTTNHQQMEIDIRTLNVVNRNENQTQKWVRSLDGLDAKKLDQKQILPSTVIARLTKQVITIKQHFFADQKIHWSVVGNQLLIHFIEEHQHFSVFEQPGTLLCIGTSLSSGFVQGRPFFANSKENAGSILVIEKLSSKDLNLLKKSNGIIVEQSIMDQRVLEVIKKYNIPTIVHAQFATKNITSNQELLLDASAGKVFSTQEKITSLQQSTKHHIGLLGGDPRLLTDQTLQGCEKYLLSSNSFFAAQGKHPLALQTKEKKQVVSEIISGLKQCQSMFANWKYLPFSMSSDFRISLTNGRNYEKAETNPHLGLRGTRYLLENTSLLNIELEALTFFQKQNAIFPKIVLPFVTSTQDLLLIKNVIKHHNSDLLKNIWVHTTSFSGCYSLLTSPVDTKGVILDFDYIAASWFGTDPQSVLSDNDLLNESEFWKILNTFKSEFPVSLEILTRNTTKQLAQKIQELELGAIITTPNHLAAARMT